MACNNYNRPCTLPVEDEELNRPSVLGSAQDSTSITLSFLFPYSYGFVEVSAISDGYAFAHKVIAYPDNMVSFNIPRAWLGGSRITLQLRWFDDSTCSGWRTETIFFYAGLEGYEDVIHNGIDVVHNNVLVTYYREERWLKHDDGEGNGILAEDGIYLGF